MREERLRTNADLPDTPVLPLSAWRGRSGRRYVVGIHPAFAFDADAMAEAVVIAVRRDPTGIAQLVSVATSRESPREHLRRSLLGRDWLERVRRGGATEMHVHRVAAGEAERAAVAADLRGDAIEPAQV